MLKRGQFFLIAALLISGSTIGFGTIYNEARVERSDTQVYDLSEEIRSELQQAYDSGIVNLQGEANQEEHISENIRTLLEYYALQNPDSNFEIVYGDDESLNRISSSQGEVSDSVPLVLGQTSESEDSTVTRTEEDVTLCMDFNSGQGRGGQGPNRGQGNNNGETERFCREFRIAEGQNFYLVVRQKVQNENVVVYR